MPIFGVAVPCLYSIEAWLNYPTDTWEVLVPTLERQWFDARPEPAGMRGSSSNDAGATSGRRAGR
jgi:hypothetical protein